MNEKLIILPVVILTLFLIFGCLGNQITVHDHNMEPVLTPGQIVSIRSPIADDFFGTEVILDRNINSVPTSEFVQPSYAEGTHVLSKLKFINGKEIEPSKGIIVSYTAYPSKVLILNRSIVKIIATDGNFVLTKGDNNATNPTFDQDCGTVNVDSNFPQKACISFFAIPINQLKVVESN